jgi:hypothetical protein
MKNAAGMINKSVFNNLFQSGKAKGWKPVKCTITPISMEEYRQAPD